MAMVDGRQRARAEAFRALHRGPRVLLLPNAWDPGSAVLLARAGFPALGTTSAGIAFALGRPDGEIVDRDRMLGVIAEIAASVEVPVTADIEAGYGESPEAVHATVRGAIAAGVVGVNIEDAVPGKGLLEEALSAERIRAAVAAADEEDLRLFVNARTDVYLTMDPGDARAFDETVQRASSYLEAGASGVFVPGVPDLQAITRLAAAIDGPLNVLGAYGGRAGPPLSALQAAGVARVSIGSSLSLAVLGLVQRAASEMATHGTFGFADGAPTYRAMNELLSS